MRSDDIMILIAVVVVVYILGEVLGGGAERRRMRKQIERMTTHKNVVAKEIETSLRRKNNDATGLLYWLMKPLPNFKALSEKLERAGKTITPKQYVLRRVIVALLIAFIISGLFKKSLILGIAVGLILGVWVPLKWLQRGITKKQKAFLRLFPDAIDLIVRGLRSGLPVSESIVLVSHEVPNPVGSVFGTINNTMKLGVPLEKALQETARHLDMTEFNFFTTSIILQRETGGNLSEILNNLSDVLRNRFLMRMKIRAMSSEARASAMIIGALPFLVIAIVSVMSPEYISILYTDYRGNICAGVAAGMMGFGLWVMNKMTKFEI